MLLFWQFIISSSLSKNILCIALIRHVNLQQTTLLVTIYFSLFSPLTVCAHAMKCDIQSKVSWFPKISIGVIIYEYIYRYLYVVDQQKCVSIAFFSVSL